jgi:hypothetical protein
MPRDRVVLTRQPDNSGSREPTFDEQAEVDRSFRRGLMIVIVAALFDVAGAVLMVLENWVAGIALVAVGFLITALAAREFTRAARNIEARRQRGY